MKDDSAEPGVSHLLEIKCLNHELESSGQSVEIEHLQVKTKEEQGIHFQRNLSTFLPKVCGSKEQIHGGANTEKRSKPHFDIMLFEILKHKWLLSYSLGIITK